MTARERPLAAVIAFPGPRELNLTARFAGLLGGLTADERAAWDDMLAALRAQDYRAASAALAKITAFAGEAEQGGG